MESPPIVDAERADDRMIEDGERRAEDSLRFRQLLIKLDEMPFQAWRDVGKRTSLRHDRLGGPTAAREMTNRDHDKSGHGLVGVSPPWRQRPFRDPARKSSRALRVRQIEMLQDLRDRPLTVLRSIGIRRRNRRQRVLQTSYTALEIRMHDDSGPQLAVKQME